MNPKDFFGELKRRNVYKVAVAYAVMGWLVIQVATQVFPFFEIPNWVVRLIVLLLLIGFPVALSLAWVFEITPEGIKRTENVEQTKSVTGNTGWKLTAFSTVMAIVATSLSLYQVFRTKSTKVASTAASASQQPDSNAIPEKSIAVLPFDNLSEDKSTAYFADGVQTEILTKLTTVRDLKVISRTSTEKYQSKPDNLKTVAQELGVANILEGSVQKAGEKVRVSVQLIDARTDAHIWARSYDRDLKDVLSVESEVSGEIAEALKANLSPGEVDVLAATSTTDPDAHDLFLRAEYERRQAESTPGADLLDRACAFYRQALSHDPNLVQAAAGLARAQLYRHWFVSPLSPDELGQVKSIIDHALERSPASPEVHYARGLLYYWGHRQYENALEEFKRTLELQPNNVSARQFCGWVYRRRGEWDRSLADVRAAEELDPLDSGIPASLGGSYLFLRLWDEAERSELRALSLDAHKAEAAILMALTHVNANGDIKAARETFSGFSEDVHLTGLIFQGDATAIVGIRSYLDLLERDFSEATRMFEKETTLGDPGHLQQLAGRVVLLLLEGDTGKARSAGEPARVLFETRVKDRPDDTFAMTELAWVYLALGRNADALHLARQAADLMSIEKDALSGTFFQNGLAQIEARAGEPEAAVKRLRSLLSIPAGQPVSLARLKIDPVWDPIRNRADFQQLLSGREQVGPTR